MTTRDQERYSRQILFSGIGAQGQERLLRASAAIVGCGALGSFQAAALARAGVAHLTIVDRDYVEPSNLHRQWLFTEADASEGLPKAVAAQRQLARINSEIHVQAIVADLNAANTEDLLRSADIILDGTDNFETRYLINDFAVSRAIPWIYGGALGSYGLAMPILPGRTACLRCVYPEPPQGVQPTCETAGILNVVAAAVGALQVAHAIKILCGHAAVMRSHITTIDVWSGGIRQIALPRADPQCPACGLRQFPYLESTHRVPISLCGRNAVQIHEQTRLLDLAALRNRLLPLGEVRANEFALRFFPRPYEMTIFPDGRAIVKGTTDISVARSLYSKYVGN